MRMGVGRSKYEAQLSVASRALRAAAERAEEIGDEGAMDDVLQLRTEVSRLMEDSVNGRKRRRRQLTMLDNSCTYL